MIVIAAPVLTLVRQSPFFGFPQFISCILAKCVYTISVCPAAPVVSSALYSRLETAAEWDPEAPADQ